MSADLPRLTAALADRYRVERELGAMMFSTHGGEGRPVLKPLEYPEVWSPDGRFLIYSFVSSSRRNLAMLDRTDGSTTGSRHRPTTKTRWESPRTERP